MAHAFRWVHRVEFVETDMAGIVHFANFFRYMEAAEHAFFRSFGCSIHMEIGGTDYCWPRVHASCDYRSPLRFEDEVEVRLTVREVKAKSISYTFTFHRSNGDEVASGAVTAVCATMDAELKRMRAIAIPDEILRHIGAAPDATGSETS